MGTRVDHTKIDSGPANVYIKEALTGTVTTTAASANVTGTGTKFLSEVAVGDYLVVTGITTELEVLSVTSDTALVLKANSGTAVSSASASAFKNVGGIVDGVTVSTETTAFDLKVDQLGESPFDSVTSGKSARISFAFAEISLTNRRRSMLEANSIVGTGASQRLDISTSVGLSSRSVAKHLRVVPIIGNVETTDKNKILNFPLASPTGETQEETYGVSQQRSLRATFQAWPDLTTGRLYYVGDPAAV